MYAITQDGFRSIASPDDIGPNEQAVESLPEWLLARMTCNAVRMERDALLRACDWTQIPDSPIDPTTRQAWADYRQALRDLPEHPDFPDCEWPTPPGA